MLEPSVQRHEGTESNTTHSEGIRIWILGSKWNNRQLRCEVKRCEPLQSTSNPGGVIKHIDNGAPVSCCLKYLTARSAGRKMRGFVFWHKHSVWIRVSKSNLVSCDKVNIFSSRECYAHCDFTHIKSQWWTAGIISNWQQLLRCCGVPIQNPPPPKLASCHLTKPWLEKQPTVALRWRAPFSFWPLAIATRTDWQSSEY